MNILYQAHSGLRYLVLLAAIAAIVALGYALATRRPVRAGRGLTAAFTGLLDLQLLLGLALVLAGIWYGALIGHLAMMVLAAVAAHAGTMIARRSADERRATTMRLGGVVLALVFIIGGIMAIGRSIVGSAPPTLG